MKNLFWVVVFAVLVASCDREAAKPGEPPAVKDPSRPGATTSRGAVETPADAFVTGTVSYRERILLRPGSHLQVALQDVSRADAPAKVVASIDLKDPGQVPISFKIPYRSSEIDDRMSYALQARISDHEGNLLFINDTHMPVLTRDGGDQADMMLVAVRSPAEGDSNPGSTPASPDQAVGMELDGLFSFKGSDPWFKDCRTGRSFPVVESGPYNVLLNAYNNSGIKKGEISHVALRGRLLEQEKEGSKHNIIMLLVDSFNTILDSPNCAPSGIVELTGTYWRLIELGGTHIPAAESGKPIHLILEQDEPKAHGFSGCNDYFSAYRLEGEALSFLRMGSTMRACLDGMEAEAAFLESLRKTDRAVLDGEFLELYSGEDKLARFESLLLR